MLAGLSGKHIVPGGPAWERPAEDLRPVPPGTDDLRRSLQRVRTVATLGRVVQAGGTLMRATGVQARVGQSCRVFDPMQPHEAGLLAEVIGFQGHEAVLAPLGSLQGLPVGAAVEVLNDVAQLPSGRGLLGRVIDAFGQPLDGGPPLDALPRVPLYRDAPSPLQRRPVHEPLVCGVRAVDALLTVGEGQRVGIFAMAGGGKSTLLGMLARSTRAEINVIGLIGERGREVREFLEDSLGAEGLARSVVVVSTSDRPALERVRAAYAATAIAEGFRAQGARVVLMMDSVTRFARGLREIGLAAGEPAVRRGYPPSVFAELPRLFERAGNDAHGSITAFYTVLAEDEEGSDPVAEEVRSILDGHLVLSRALAEAQHYPAIDVLASASRVFTRVTTPEQQRDAARLRALMARHKEVEFLLRVGEYQAGSDPLADQAIERMPQIKALLQQGSHEPSDWDGCLQHLREIVS